MHYSHAEPCDKGCNEDPQPSYGDSDVVASCTPITKTSAAFSPRQRFLGNGRLSPWILRLPARRPAPPAARRSRWWCRRGSWPTVSGHVTGDPLQRVVLVEFSDYMAAYPALAPTALPLACRDYGSEEAGAHDLIRHDHASSLRLPDTGGLRTYVAEGARAVVTHQSNGGQLRELNFDRAGDPRPRCARAKPEERRPFRVFQERTSSRTGEMVRDLTPPQATRIRLHLPLVPAWTL